MGAQVPHPVLQRGAEFTDLRLNVRSYPRKLPLAITKAEGVHFYFLPSGSFSIQPALLCF
ncbi:hypothetical protein, partial [Klebsiella variicola]|uniref:hypothetical protein n=1 Tax=Klebsiella variicola TaxID=244366 RepID=UPI003F668906